ncbi:unnamed protein product [Gongylonema pulchrum]|uniref:HTH_48 domain-containing protein n=1 Tax=Gongylonema pulchrum TaxID=637853 RepID=A0A183E7I4_9BILA|nr:unnamed protein product [Gongylonema pulchrum]
MNEEVGRKKKCDTEAERIIAAFIRNRQFDSKAKLVEKITRSSEKYVSGFFFSCFDNFFH